jgi:hypothetical protein
MSKPKLTELEAITLEARLLEILQYGHRNAIGLSDLVKRTATNERKLRIAIENLRNEANPNYIICFGQKTKTIDKNGNKIILPNGYYLASTKQEYEEFKMYMRSRIISECLILRNLKLAANKKFDRVGQLPLFFD